MTVRASVAVLAVLVLLPLRAAATCPADLPVTVVVSPKVPTADAPLRVVAVGTDGPVGTVGVRGADGRPLAPEVIRHGGPPWSVVATVEPVPGPLRAEVRRGTDVVGCAEVEVVAGSGTTAPDAPGTRAWEAGTTALYAAWIEHLFGAAEGQASTLTGLADVLHDPERNFLHDHLQLGEDGPGGRALVPKPDCADLPYVLRAYFAWKLGLPFAARACSRGGGGRPPTCGGLGTILPALGPAVPPFAGFLRRVMDAVHSGSARTGLADDATDFYPLALDRAALWPGTIYADPYGHTLMIVRWVPQAPDRPGLLLAVDAQPDESMGYKRFWEGTFLFADEPTSGPGFKAFRPLVARGGGVRARGNADLDGRDGIPAWSDAQIGLDPDEFYARMAALIDPAGLSPTAAYERTLDALAEQLETRVGSVDNGERWKRTHPGTVVEMPAGAAIFETIGPWEDYATPSRDLRLLIAIHVLETLPARIERHPELFVLGGRAPAQVRAGVEALHARAPAERTIAYTRSDGSTWTLTLAEVLARRAAFETAYNPNDCVEVRWGAAEGSDERAPCARRAPPAQQARMAQYRDWFRERRRPPR
ncbi:MAG: hypothetical protein KIT14_25845 [bacterium]|nr:hypothetical protein [bacterium]